MGDDLYALEKISDAVQCLVTGPGRIRERLGEAYTHLYRIQPEDIPNQEMRRQLIGINDDLTFDVSANSTESRLEATLRNLSDEDASQIAGRVLELYRQLWMRFDLI